MDIKTGAALIAAFLLGAPGPAPLGIEGLAWMSGKWTTEGGGRWTEEQWSAPRGGTMLGFSRTGSAEAIGEFEFLRLAEDEHGLVTYWASPGGRPAVGFRLVEAGASSATFENPLHDFPVRISYRRDGPRLTATIAGAGGSNPQSWEYRRQEN
jgi:hypothetical protein